MTAPTVSAEDLGDALATVRASPPLVQCMTNIVVAGWTANVLLAAGMAPAMVDNPEEAAGFAGVASGILINLGTPYTDTTRAMSLAADAANAASTPWVLDPVAAGGLAWRTVLASSLLERRPAILRGNASEVSAMAGGAGGRGVDSTLGPEAARETATSLAGERSIVVAVSGPVDVITDGDRLVRIDNGHELLTRVTGVGCALGALMAGFAGAVDDPLVAAAAATALMTVAADRAVLRSPGPGSFAVSLLDELAAVTPEALVSAVRLP